MQNIAELERRITAAMERISKGVDAKTAAETAALGNTALQDEIARLTEALDEERMANAQLNERVRVLHDKGAETGGEDLTAQIAAQAAEIAELRRVLAGAGDEIAALRAARAAEAAEVAAIAAALEPLVAEVTHA